MRLDEQILERLKAISQAPNLVFPATVKSVDLEKFTCNVLPQNEVEIFNVRLKAGVEKLSEGIVEVPALNSSVLVVLIGNTEGNAFVAKCSKVEEVLFYGGGNGGLIRVEELVKQLDRVNQQLETIKSTFNTWVPVPTDGGASLKANMTAALSKLLPADYSAIENTKVKH